MGKRARAFAVEMWVTLPASRSTAAPEKRTRMASAAWRQGQPPPQQRLAAQRSTMRRTWNAVWRQDLSLRRQSIVAPRQQMETPSTGEVGAVWGRVDTLLHRHTAALRRWMMRGSAVLGSGSSQRPYLGTTVVQGRPTLARASAVPGEASLLDVIVLTAALACI